MPSSRATPALFESVSMPVSPGLKGTSFESVFGQEAACEILLSALRAVRVPHAYLFAGPEGVGKRTAALQWAKTLNCLSPVSPVRACGACGSCRKISALNHPDVLWVNFEYQAHVLEEPVEKQRILKINTVREMIQTLHLKPLEGRVKVAVVDPADRLGADAAHALLKVLEEPPPQTHLILLAQDPSQLLGTIRSRCQWVRFRPLATELLATYLTARAPDRSPEDISALAAQAEGSLSRALEILEQGAEMDFDWETAPLSELLLWCEQFRGRGSHRDEEKGGESSPVRRAEDFLRRLLARLELELRRGAGDPEKVRRVLEALHQLKQNVSPQLVLEVLLLKSRRQRRKKEQAIG
ncbi:MAG TPA: DNA polymerase III subunit delta' [Elusimicrobiota bacterium]|nr:DNA polymerase III subunit delta' [Elusimicrobiota bacterium]